MIRIGQKAPDFSCDAVINKEIKTISLNDYKKQYKILFFYPLDFTFVCPTELHAIQNSLNQFKQKNTEIFGISVDSAHSHLAWLNTPKSKGGIEGINFTLISDLNKKISTEYNVLNEAGVAFRAVFILDQNNVVQHASVNNLGLGRNINEILRLIDALQHHEKHGEVCPANWNIGEKSMMPTKDGLNKFFN